MENSKNKSASGESSKAPGDKKDNLLEAVDVVRKEIRSCREK